MSGAEEEKEVKSAVKLLAVAIILVFVLAPIGSGLAEVISRPSHYEGMQITFDGLRIGSVSNGGDYTINHYYTDGDKYKAPSMDVPPSVSLNLGTVFNFDIDGAGDGKANFVSSVDQPYADPDFSSVWKDETDGLIRTFSWDYTDPVTDEQLHYEMDEWIFEFNINLAIQAGTDDERGYGRYLDSVLWLNFEPYFPQYFEVDGVEFKQSYMAIAAAEVEKITVGLASMSEDEIRRANDMDMDTSPTKYMQTMLNEGLDLCIFYESPGGAQTSGGSVEQGRSRYTHYYDARTKLSQDVFRPNYYLPIGLTSLGTDSWGALFFWGWSADALSARIRLHLFTVGEWKVMKEEHVDWKQLVGSYGEKSTFDRFIIGLMSFLGSLFGWLAIIIPIILLIVVVLFVLPRLGIRRKHRRKSHSH